MRYVIQNFNYANKRINVTPKFKYALVYNNTTLILFFFKNTAFLLLNETFNPLNFNPFFNIYKFFYINEYPKLCNELNSNLSGSVQNNLTNGIVNNILSRIERNFWNTIILHKRLKCEDSLQFNQYFLATKITYVGLSKNFYKNFFFFILIFSSHFWYQHAFNVKFYLNYLITFSDLQAYTFYNGPFFKIYNV